MFAVINWDKVIEIAARLPGPFYVLAVLILWIIGYGVWSFFAWIVRIIGYRIYWGEWRTDV